MVDDAVNARPWTRVRATTVRDRFPAAGVADQNRRNTFDETARWQRLTARSSITRIELRSGTACRCSTTGCARLRSVVLPRTRARPTFW